MKLSMTSRIIKGEPQPSPSVIKEAGFRYVYKMKKAAQA